MGAEPVAVLYASISVLNLPVQGDKDRCDMGPLRYHRSKSR